MKQRLYDTWLEWMRMNSYIQIILLAQFCYYMLILIKELINLATVEELSTINKWKQDGRRKWSYILYRKVQKVIHSWVWKAQTLTRISCRWSKWKFNGNKSKRKIAWRLPCSDPTRIRPPKFVNVWMVEGHPKGQIEPSEGPFPADPDPERVPAYSPNLLCSGADWRQSQSSDVPCRYIIVVGPTVQR